MNSADKCQGFPESCKISFRRILSEVRQANRGMLISTFQIPRAQTRQTTEALSQALE
jgi:hypothetical protein